MKRWQKGLLLLALVSSLAMNVPVQAGGYTKVCRKIPHGRKCWVNGQYYSINCQSGYHVEPPGMGTRCVKNG